MCTGTLAAITQSVRVQLRWLLLASQDVYRYLVCYYPIDTFTGTLAAISQSVSVEVHWLLLAIQSV